MSKVSDSNNYKYLYYYLIVLLRDVVSKNMKLTKSKSEEDLDTKVKYAIKESIHSHSENYRFEYSESNIIAKNLTKEKAEQMKTYFEKNLKKYHPKQPYMNGRYRYLRYIELLETKHYFIEEYKNEKELFSAFDEPNDKTTPYHG